MLYQKYSQITDESLFQFIEHLGFNLNDIQTVELEGKSFQLAPRFEYLDEAINNQNSFSFQGQAAFLRTWVVIEQHENAYPSVKLVRSFYSNSDSKNLSWLSSCLNGSEGYREDLSSFMVYFDLNQNAELRVLVDLISLHEKLEFGLPPNDPSDKTSFHRFFQCKCPSSDNSDVQFESSLVCSQSKTGSTYRQ